MADGVRLPIEIIKGDVSGIAALNSLNAVVEESVEALDALVTSGAAQGVFDAKDIELATTRIAAMAAQASLLEHDIEQAAAAIAKMNGTEENYGKDSAALLKKAEQYQRLRLEIEKIPKTLQEVAEKASNFDDRYSGLRERVGVYGDTESAGRATLGAIGAFGGQTGQQIESLGNLVAELLAAREALPLLVDGFKEIGKRAKEGSVALLANTQIYGALVTKVIALTGAKSSEAVATASLLAVTLPFVAAAAAAAAALYYFQQQTKGQREATQALVKNLEAYYETLNTGTTETINNQLEQLKLQKQIRDEQIADQRSRLEAFADETNLLQEGLARAFNIGGVNDYRNSLIEAEKESKELAATIGLLERAAADARVQARSYAEALVAEGQIRADVADSFDTGGLQEVINQINAAADARENAFARLAFLESQVAGATQEQVDAIRAQQKAIVDGDITSAQRQFEALNEVIIGLGYSSVEAAQAAQEAADAQTDAILQERQLRDQLLELVDNGSSEQLAARREAINQELAAILSVLPELNALADESQVAADAAQEYQERLELLVAEQNLLTDNVEALIVARENEAAAAAEQLVLLNEQVAFEQQAAALIREASVETVNSRLQALEDERAALNNVLPQLQALAATSEEAAAQLATYEDRLGAIGREADFLTNEVLPQATINQRRKGLQELVQAEKDSAQAMIEARQDALDKIKDVEAKANEGRADAYKQKTESINKAESDSIKAREKANKDYMAASIKETREFFQREKELEKEHKEEVLKARQDMLNSMLAAEEANDVVAFVRAQAAGNERLKELETGGDKEKAQRQAEFDQRQKERAAEHRAALDDIREREKEARIAAQEAYNERLIDIQNTVDEEKQKIQDSLTERANAERDALKARADEIKTQYGLEQNLIRQGGALRAQAAQEANQLTATILNNLKNAVASAKASAASMNKSASSSGTYSGSSYSTANYGSSGTIKGVGAGASTGFAFADADMRVVRQPTQALIGENLKPGEFEVVHKYNPSHLLPKFQGGGGGDGITLNIDLSGSNLRLDEVDNRVRAGLAQVVGAISKARKQ